MYTLLGSTQWDDLNFVIKCLFYNTVYLFWFFDVNCKKNRNVFLCTTYPPFYPDLSSGFPFMSRNKITWCKTWCYDHNNTDATILSSALIKKLSTLWCKTTCIFKYDWNAWQDHHGYAANAIMQDRDYHWCKKKREQKCHVGWYSAYAINMITQRYDYVTYISIHPTVEINLDNNSMIWMEDCSVHKKRL